MGWYKEYLRDLAEIKAAELGAKEEDIPTLVDKLNPGEGWGFLPLKRADVTAIYKIAAHATL